ncbi:MAG: (deoxy)nucleoside triphosphate pyrophosphohydrolase [Candidatus Nanopelagicales bacterium]
MDFESMLKVGAAAIVRNGAAGWEMLSARRTEPPVAAGFWEFPGGKLDPGETPEQCVVREIREELGVDVVLREHIAGPREGWWALSEHIVFSLWLCTIVEGQEPVILEDHDALAWLDVDALYSVTWIPADEAIVREIEAMLRAANATGNFPTSAT